MTKSKWYRRFKRYLNKSKHGHHYKSNDFSIALSTESLKNKNLNNEICHSRFDIAKTEEFIIDSFKQNMKSQQVTLNDTRESYNDFSFNYLSEATSINVLDTDNFSDKDDDKYCTKEIGKLGLHKLSTRNSHYYTGVIYLMENNLILAHYLTLYRIKMDLFNEIAFKTWCQNFGHTETAGLYKKLYQIYEEMKSNYFRESYIINQIISKKNVHLRITDRFGDDNYKLRAFIIVGNRKLTVQSIIDSYCFSIKGNVPVIIRNYKELDKFLHRPNSRFTQVEAKDWEVPSTLSNITRSKTPNNKPFSLPQNKSRDVLEILDVNLNTLNEELKQKKFDSLVYEPLNKSVNQQNPNIPKRKLSEIPKLNFENNNYKILNVVSDEQYNYLLCHRVNNNGDCAKDIMPLEINEHNQSNELNKNFNVIYNVIKQDLAKLTPSKPNLGVDLKNYPCGQFYKVEFDLTYWDEAIESSLGDIFHKLMISGKIIQKYDNSDGETAQIQVIGGSQRILKCLNDLNTLGRLTNISLKHPKNQKINHSNGIFNYKRN